MADDPKPDQPLAPPPTAAAPAVSAPKAAAAPKPAPPAAKAPPAHAEHPPKAAAPIGPPDPPPPAGACSRRHLGVGKLVRARGVRHVRRELRRAPGSPPNPDAGGLAGPPAAQGLPARRPRRAANGEPARLAEAPADTRRGRHRVNGNPEPRTQNPEPRTENREPRTERRTKNKEPRTTLMITPTA